MIDRLTPSTPPENPAGARTSVHRSDAEFTLDAAAKSAPARLEGGVPATPPPEVLYALDRAQSVLSELASRQISMKFSVDESSKIRVELYDGDGKLIREVPPAHATAMLSGERPIGWLSN